MSISYCFSRTRVATVVSATVLAACAASPVNNAVLDDARTYYQRAAADAQVARSAPLELRKAQQALQQAEAAQRAGDDTGAVEHYAYLAKQRAEVAVQAGKIAEADQAVTKSSSERGGIVIASRTREADTQRSAAETARKLAEERLAAAKAASAQAASARARAKSLEEQLAELKAKPTDRGMVLTLGDVLFDTGRAELNPGAARTLDRLTTFMKENPERTIAIEGYTDSIGSDSLNQVLSERRAIAVKNALMDRGIALHRISARGFGESSPVASNATASGRQQNRRVEIVVLKD